MKISIIVTIYKAEQYIARCLQSVICQTFTDYEVILVDDASPDNALAIAETLLIENNSTFQTIKHQQNKGLSEARNSGIKVAKGKYLMFIDSDDELANENVLQLFYETIEREKVDFVTGYYLKVYDKNISRKDTYSNEFSKHKKLTGLNILKAITNNNIPVMAWNKLINKKFLLNHNLYFRKGLINEDELWSFELCIAAKNCYCLKKYSYNYYQTNPNSIMRTLNYKSYYNEITFIIKEQLNIITEKQLLNVSNVNSLALYISKRSTNLLGMCANSLDKPFWLKMYREIQKSYKNSALYPYKKLLRLPENLAYFVFIERIKPYKFLGSKYYLKFVDSINRYNWEGKI